MGEGHRGTLGMTFDPLTLRIMTVKVLYIKRRPYPDVSGVPGFVVVGHGSVVTPYPEPQSDLILRPL